jgi:hypothetical protein
MAALRGKVRFLHLLPRGRDQDMYYPRFTPHHPPPEAGSQPYTSNPPFPAPHIPPPRPRQELPEAPSLQPWYFQETEIEQCTFQKD